MRMIVSKGNTLVTTSGGKSARPAVTRSAGEQWRPEVWQGSRHRLALGEQCACK